MLAAMDIRLASEKAKIGFVFEKIGITPEVCSSWFLPRIVGITLATKMMLRLYAMPTPRDAHNVDSLAIFYASQLDEKE